MELGFPFFLWPPNSEAGRICSKWLWVVSGTIFYNFSGKKLTLTPTFKKSPENVQKACSPKKLNDKIRYYEWEAAVTDRRIKYPIINIRITITGYNGWVTNTNNNNNKKERTPNMTYKQNTIKSLQILKIRTSIN